MYEEKIYDENLKSYSLYELYTLLTPILDKIYNNYRDVIEEPKLRKMALKIIKECVMNFDINNGISFKEYFEKNMSNYFNTYIHNLSGNKDKKINLINNYITNNIVIANSYDSAIIEMKKLCAFFTSIEYKPKFNTCEKIVNNKKITNMLKIIVAKNIDLIEEERINEIIDDKIFVLLIDTYCSINEIIRYDNNINNNDNNNDIDLPSTPENLKIYMKEISKIPLLTKEQEVELFNKYGNGDESAREKIIESNLPLVVDIAKKIKEKYYYSDAHFLDLIQEGNMGLITAVDNFDVSKGNKFSTYATWYIKWYIQGAITQSDIRVSQTIKDFKSKIEKARFILKEKLNKEPSYEEISKETNISLQVVKKICMTFLEKESLNAPINNEEGADELEYFIPSEEKSVEEQAEQKILQEELLNLFDKAGLSEMEKIVLKECYGIGTNSKKFSDIGKKYKKTREGIRQNHDKAIAKLSKFPETKKFIIYIYDTNCLSEIEKHIDDEILTQDEQIVLKKIYGIGIKKESITDISKHSNFSESEIIEIFNNALRKLHFNNQKKF